MVSRDSNIGRPQLFKNTPCIICKQNVTYISKKGYEHWHVYINPAGRICHKCYQNSDYNKKLRKSWSKRSSQKRITFKNKRVYITFNPRTGICTNCGKQGKTNMHHEKYDENNPLNHTIELCVSCHKKHHWDIKKGGVIE